jgi:diguanylate cyclase (GGDEF)-like protein
VKIRDHAAKFTVYVYAADIDIGAGIKVALAQAGYDAFFFEDRDTLFNRIQEKVPHIVIFPTSSLKDQLSDFVEKILKLNSEIRMILVAKPKQFGTLAAYNDYGVVDLLNEEMEGLAPRAAFAVDRACEGLYLQYQNEKLLDELNAQKGQLGQALQEATVSKGAAARMGPPLDERIKDYRSSESKEELLRKFMVNMGRVPCVFMKYLPSVRSLVVTHATGFEADRLQGVGCQLTNEEAKDFGTQISLGIVPPSLSALLMQAFQLPQSRLLPIFVGGRPDGLMAYPATLTPEEKDRLQDEFALMSLCYSNLTLEKRVDLLEIQDPVTEIYNRAFYLNRIKEEWTRARRIQQPLCVVKVALDDFFELEQTLGEATRDLLLKNVAQLIHKTSRTNDVTCRSGLNEFAMILPHAHRQGAMIRAERLRRIVESSQMLENGLKISISLGISEYPTLASSAETLDETSSKALAHIMDKGGNRLCLYKAPVDHKPEFEVVVEPGT